MDTEISQKYDFNFYMVVRKKIETKKSLYDDKIKG